MSIHQTAERRRQLEIAERMDRDTEIPDPIEHDAWADLVAGWDDDERNWPAERDPRNGGRR